MMRSQFIHLIAVTLLTAGVLTSSVSYAARTNAAGSKPGASASKAGSTNAAPAEAPIPQSVFVVPESREDGVDPFFPLSKRFEVVVATPRTNKPVARAELLIKGFSGTSASPLVIINDTTFGVGDRQDVSTPQGRTTVYCIAISLKEQMAVIEVNGERRELQFQISK